MAAANRYASVMCIALAAGAATVVVAQEAARNPPAAPVTFAKGVRSANPRAATPQFAAIAPGLYSRTILDTRSAKGDYRIRILSLSVSPKVTTGDVKLPGAAMLSLTAGSIEFVAGEQRGKLRPGDNAAIPEGASLQFINGDTRAAVLRAVVVSGE